MNDSAFLVVKLSVYSCFIYNLNSPILKANPGLVNFNTS